MDMGNFGWMAEQFAPHGWLFGLGMVSGLIRHVTGAMHPVVAIQITYSTERAKTTCKTWFQKAGTKQIGAKIMVGRF